MRRKKREACGTRWRVALPRIKSKQLARAGRSKPQHTKGWRQFGRNRLHETILTARGFTYKSKWGKKHKIRVGGIVYVKLWKALYGTLQAALLFWKDLSGQLEQWEFVLNPYDDCVANKIIDGRQCTILWHVDDLEISHVDPKVVNHVIGLLNDRYGKEAPLTVTRGKTNDYLGMTIDFAKKGKVTIDMRITSPVCLRILTPTWMGKQSLLLQTTSLTQRAHPFWWTKIRLLSQCDCQTTIPGKARSTW